MNKSIYEFGKLFIIHLGERDNETEALLVVSADNSYVIITNFENFASNWIANSKFITHASLSATSIFNNFLFTCVN